MTALFGKAPSGTGPKRATTASCAAAGLETSGPQIEKTGWPRSAADQFNSRALPILPVVSTA